jgi:head-tail adaptor
MKLPKPKYYTEKYKLKPHEFRSKIEILKLAETVDEDNIPTKEYILVSTEMANINTTTVDETSDSKGIIDIHRMRAIIRFPLSYQVTEKMIVKYNQDYYNIIAVSDVQEVHMFLELTLERVRS